MILVDCISGCEADFNRVATYETESACDMTSSYSERHIIPVCQALPDREARSGLQTGLRVRRTRRM